jgi:hypothetical protein
MLEEITEQSELKGTAIALWSASSKKEVVLAGEAEIDID